MGQSAIPQNSCAELLDSKPTDIHRKTPLDFSRFWVKFYKQKLKPKAAFIYTLQYTEITPGRQSVSLYIVLLYNQVCSKQPSNKLPIKYSYYALYFSVHF